MAIDSELKKRFIMIARVEDSLAEMDEIDKRRLLQKLNACVHMLTGERPAPVVSTDKRDCIPCRDKMIEQMKKESDHAID